MSLGVVWQKALPDARLVAANRLSSISNASGTTTYSSYDYNGDGDRISQTVNGTLTTYVLDIATPLTMVLAESTGSHTTRYWHGLDTLAQSNGTTTDYFTYDGLGSVRQLVGESGSVGLAQTFDPYGNGFSKAGSTSSSFGYSGEQVDANGFVYLRARYYQPGMGRFTQMDPSRQESNAYLYCAGNPINLVDPSGLWRFNGVPGGNFMHEVIEDLYVRAWGGDLAHSEYPIPLPFGGGGQLDMLNIITGEIWEIKPIGSERQGWRQMLGYVGKMNVASYFGLLTSTNVPNINGNYDWNRYLPGSANSGTNFSGNWRGTLIGLWWPGLVFPRKVPVGFTGTHIAFAGMRYPGVIVYWFEPYDPLVHATIVVGTLAVIRALKKGTHEQNWVKKPGFQPGWEPAPAISAQSPQINPGPGIAAIALLLLLQAQKICTALSQAGSSLTVPIIIWPPPQMWGCREIEGQLYCPGDSIKG